MRQTSITREELVADLPQLRPCGLAEVSAAIRGVRKLVVLDDDPTGTQSVIDLPVLTQWRDEDLTWALRTDTPAFFVLTNTRSLTAPEAEAVNRDVLRNLQRTAAALGIDYAIASRSDSTLRGHFPLETDAITDTERAAGRAVDGVIVVPAFLDAGRVTIDSTHWLTTDTGLIPVSKSEFARDPSFAYSHSDLRAWVEEKSHGRIQRSQVPAITLRDLRCGGPARVAELLATLTLAQVIVVDALDEDDLRVLVLGILHAEREGLRFVYRTGPSFVRARCAQSPAPPIALERLRTLLAPADTDNRPVSSRGLIVVGSHVGMTTRQLQLLRAEEEITALQVDVPRLMQSQTSKSHCAEIAAAAIEHLGDPNSNADLVIGTSREVISAEDRDRNLTVAQTVSSALVTIVRDVLASVRPHFVLAKGGITSADIASKALDISRAWTRGNLLPGVVSLWEPATGPSRGIPYVVFPGNVGGEDGLVTVVRTLRQI
ncbi:four-carbon acid sugar kinase family protein [Mycolicibacterium sp. 624]|uniref:four-carbon acid sugar kinase family protein n=1 Tax=Mycolicibacterium sp. 624 TaxID=3156314 RepID=UPI00339A1A8E